MNKTEMEKLAQEMRETIDKLELTIGSFETDYQIRLKNQNIRFGKLEEKLGKVYTKLKAVDRRQGCTESDILAINGSMLTIGGKDISSFKALPKSTNPPLGQAIGKNDVFDNNTNTVAAEPEIEITGIELHKGVKTCHIKS